VKITFCFLACSVIGSTFPAWGAGFENGTMWSGEYAGVSNAVVSSVSGSQSIYFNPAGLAGLTGVEVSGNFSPTLLWFQGPVLGTIQNSNTSFGPIFGVTAGFGITPQWGVGLGVYTSGGGKADYNPVSFASIGLPTAGNLQGDLSFNEISIGTGYEILPGLKIGIAWRGVLAQSTLALPNIVASAPAQSSDTTFSGLSQFSAAAYKVGMQWALDPTWNIGADYRSNVNFDHMSGSFSTTALANGSIVDTGSGSVNTAFPSQLSVGVSHAFTKSFKALLQYDWTNYQKIDAIRLTTVGPATGTTYSQVPTGWSNMSDGRVGFEYVTDSDWALRAGFEYASSVVPIGLANPIFTAPGSENSYSAGVGKKFTAALRADVALDYVHSSGSGQAGNPGMFSDSELSLHTGATMAF
jgi:long-subunit fatty acid transport protein